MPKSRKSKHTILALDETTCKMEKIFISPEARRKFKDAGKVKRVRMPLMPEPVKTPVFSQEELQEIQQEHKEHLSTLSLLSRLTNERNSLVDRLEDSPPPLIQRIEPYIYHSSPIPNNIHFHQTKKLLRIKEFREFVQPTLDVITPFFYKMSGDAKWAGNDHYTPLWTWFYRLEDIVIEMDIIAHGFTAKEWRLLKGACKRIRKVDFSHLSTRIPEICDTLLSLDITLP
jgi:hypothetical protein